MKRRKSMLSLVCVLWLWGTAEAEAITYTFTSLDYPGAVTTGAYGVNDQGHVVGLHQTASDATLGIARGFVFDGASYQEVTVAGCDQAMAFGINNADEVVGVCQTANGVHGFLKSLSTGEEAIYNAPGATGTRLHAINIDGFMAGGTHEGSRSHGVLTDAVTWTVFDAPGADATQVFGLNTGRTMVGHSLTFGTSHGFLTPDGVNFTPIDYPGANYTVAFGLSNGGLVSGTFNRDGTYHGFLWDGSTYTILDVPGSPHTEGHGLSPNATKLVGAYNDAPGQQHGFLATAQVDSTPPAITVAASPATLSPPNGRLVTVAVSGTITDEDGGSGVKVGSAAYVVMDEYGQIHPSGNLTLGAGGSYAFAVALEASRRGNDSDGRHYTIGVSAKDNIGNPGFKSATVTVPRN
jgi:hypothetical protein